MMLIRAGFLLCMVSVRLWMDDAGFGILEKGIGDLD